MAAVQIRGDFITNINRGNTAKIYWEKTLSEGKAERPQEKPNPLTP
jgi:hypothetical protein